MAQLGVINYNWPGYDLEGFAARASEIGYTSCELGIGDIWEGEGEHAEQRAEDVRRLFEKHGLRIFRIEHIPVHGGSMRVYGCRSVSSHPVEPSVTGQIALESERGLESLETYLAFAERVQRSRVSLIELLRGLQADGARVVGYAASSKGTVILNYCGIGSQMLEYVCDNTPSKQGLFTPGTHIPIVPIDQFAADYPDYAFVLAWNHLNEIASKERAFRAQGGKFITHIPTARIE